MNMHGIMTPVLTTDGRDGPSRLERISAWVRRKRVFLLVVVLPLVLTAGYLFLIASDQYESEAHFLVRSTSPVPVAGTGVSQVLSMATGLSSAQSEAMSVADYLTSHDVVEALRKENRLVERFQDPSADFISRLRGANPTPEKLLSYYRQQVEVEHNTETGITTLQVRSFKPQDSYDLVRKLLVLGEQRVNILNTRGYEDAIAVSRRQFAEAEAALAQVQGQLTRFRQTRGDIDPQASGQAQLGLVTSLTGQLSAAQAQLSAMGSMIDRSSPQYRALSARVSALSAQLAAQSGRLTGGSEAIANDISGYEGLRLRQEFLAKRYEAAASSLQKAREQALQQQLYVVRVVEPNMPVKSLYPARWRVLATMLISLLLVYSIGWLIVAGVKEHSA
jgi:capsular polysaccharide transport system permease protein